MRYRGGGWGGITKVRYEVGKNTHQKPKAKKQQQQNNAMPEYVP